MHSLAWQWARPVRNLDNVRRESLSASRVSIPLNVENWLLISKGNRDGFHSFLVNVRLPHPIDKGGFPIASMPIGLTIFAGANFVSPKLSEAGNTREYHGCDFANRIP